VKIGTRKFTEMICVDDDAFAVVERQGFRGVIEAISGEVGLVSSRHQEADDFDTWYDEYTVISRGIGGNSDYCLYFSVGVDGWKNVTAHKPMLLMFISWLQTMSLCGSLQGTNGTC
jgi:hypothetical protein